MEYSSYQHSRQQQRRQQRGKEVTVDIPIIESDPPLSKSSDTNMKKDVSKQDITPHSLGFKNIVIYVLLFVNFVLLTKLASTFSRQQHRQQHQQQVFALCKDSEFKSFALASKQEYEPEHGEGDVTSLEFWLKMALIVFLVMLGGIFAGLTIGLMGLDETNLHVLMASGSPKEQIHAEIVYGLLSRGKHWVLVTLLLGNVIVNETLPVVLDSELGGGIVAILISTMLIVVFGEIIPQAICARYGLAIGAHCAKPMMVFMYIMSPIAYPIAMILDSWLGVHHGTTYRRTELKTLVSLHQVDGIGELTDDEVTIIASVLDLKEKSVSQVMTPLEDVFTLSEDAILDEDLMEEIVSAGYSRIPIYRHDDPSNFIGMLLVKRLITYDPQDHIPVRQFTINSLPEAAPNTSCLDILNFFQEGRSHMAMVTSEPGGFGAPVGVITLEDVIEELLGEEIVDESDVYVDVHNKIKVIRKPTRNVNMIKNLKNFLQSPAPTPLLVPNNAPVNSSSTKEQSTGEPNLTGHSVENPKHYMSTGKTILLSRNTSTEALGRENQPLLNEDHECAFRTGSIKSSRISTPKISSHDPATKAPPERRHPQSIAEDLSGQGSLMENAKQKRQRPYQVQQYSSHLSDLKVIPEIASAATEEMDEQGGKHSVKKSIESTGSVASIATSTTATMKEPLTPTTVFENTTAESPSDDMIDSMDSSPAPSATGSKKKKKKNKK